MTEKTSDLDALEPLVASALERPPAERTAEFARLRASFPEHAEMLERAEAAARRVDQVLPHETPTLAEDTSATPSGAEQSTIDCYRILDVLGEGGMGTVYLAEQAEPLRRCVALKVIKLGMDSRQVLGRFELERQALAMMNHEFIAKAFDAGTTERGHPYFVMEFVEGTPIHDYCAEHRLSVRDRVALVRSVCDGVRHAHERSVVHRDLKPTNILVTRRDGRDVPKIIDFGLARIMDPKVLNPAVRTEVGQILGTPTYMAPEQVVGEVGDIDARTDVYALGIILFELLVGEPPFHDRNARGPAALVAWQNTRNEAFPRPSTKVRDLVARGHEIDRHESTDSLVRALRGDLDSVVLKALAWDRKERYASVRAFGEDLDRYLAGKPVRAMPPTLTYRASRWVRRNGGVVAMSAAAMLTLMALALVWSTSAQGRFDHELAQIAQHFADRDYAGARGRIDVALAQFGERDAEHRQLMKLRAQIDRVEKLTTQVRRYRVSGPVAPGTSASAIERDVSRSNSAGPPPPWRSGMDIEDISSVLRSHDLLSTATLDDLGASGLIQMAGLYSSLDQYGLAQESLERVNVEERSNWTYRATAAVLALRRDFNTGDPESLPGALADHQLGLQVLLAEAEEDDRLSAQVPLMAYNLSIVAEELGEDRRAAELRKQATAHPQAPTALLKVLAG